MGTPKVELGGGHAVALQPRRANRRTEHRRTRSLVEFALVLLLSIGLYVAAVHLDFFERFDGWVDLHERLQVDELLLVLPVGMLLLAIYSWRRYREAQAETEVAVAAERDLARVTEEYRSLFENHPHAVFAIDPERRYRHVNPAAQTLGGHTEEEMLALEFPALKTPDRGRILTAFDQAMSCETQRLDSTVIRKDGERRDVDVLMVPIIVEGDAVGVYVLARDVTDDNRMRAELARALVDADQASDAKTLLIANVSHELRTPLASAIGATEVLAETVLDDVQRRMVEMIGRSGQVLRRLVNDLLDITRLEVGQLVVEEVPFDLPELLDQTVAHASTGAANKGLTVKTQLDDALPRRVLGDPLRLGQVLTNLLGNAVKFTDRGEVGLAVTGQHRDGKTLDAVFRVWDTGIGIAPHDLDRLFGHFVQGDPSSTRRHGGVGLGLAISRQLVDLMNGDLAVESDIGTGSTFTVRVPLSLAETS